MNLYLGEGRYTESRELYLGLFKQVGIFTSTKK